MAELAESEGEESGKETSEAAVGAESGIGATSAGARLETRAEESSSATATDAGTAGMIISAVEVPCTCNSSSNLTCLTLSSTGSSTATPTAATPASEIVTGEVDTGLYPNWGGAAASNRVSPDSVLFPFAGPEMDSDFAPTDPTSTITSISTGTTVGAGSGDDEASTKALDTEEASCPSTGAESGDSMRAGWCSLSML